MKQAALKTAPDDTVATTVSLLPPAPHFWFKLTLFPLLIILAAILTGCPGNSPSDDTTPPAEVTGLTVSIGIERVTLSWTDPTDSDFKEVEISSSDGGPFTVAKGIRTKGITGLTNDTEYTFTVKTVDTSGNKSEGITKTAIPIVTKTNTYWSIGADGELYTLDVSGTASGDAYELYVDGDFLISSGTLVEETTATTLKLKPSYQGAPIVTVTVTEDGDIPNGIPAITKDDGTSFTPQKPAAADTVFLKANFWDGGSDWHSWYGAGKLSTLYSSGQIKSNAQYRVKITGNSDQNLKGFRAVFGDRSNAWKEDITYWPSSQPIAAGTFDVTFIVQTTTINPANYAHYYLAVETEDPVPDGKKRGDVMATLTHVAVTIEEIPQDTVFLYNHNNELWENGYSYKDSFLAIPNIIPDGIKNNTNYIITITGNSDADMDRFYARLVDQDFEDIPTDHNKVPILKGEFTYTARWIIPSDAASATELVFKNQVSSPAGTKPGDVLATISDITISLEEIPEDTVLLIAAIYEDGGSLWYSWEGFGKLSKLYSSEQIKSNTQYQVHITGNSVQDLEGFYPLIFDKTGDDWEMVINWPEGQPIEAGEFDVTFILQTTTINPAHYANYYLEVQAKNPVPAGKTDGDLMATLTHVEVTIEELND